MENNPTSPTVRVGIGVWIFNSKGEVLMMHRQGSHGSGTWAPPGGKLDIGESFFDCARRETKEETGLDIKDVEIVGVTNDIFSPDKHYVTVFVKAISWTGEPKIMEPEKCTSMGWYPFHAQPEPMFLTGINIFKSDFPCLCGSGRAFRDCPNKKVVVSPG